jgi:nucleoside phosphorylase
LHSPELDKLLRTGPDEWLELDARPDDPQTYHASSYTTTAGKVLRVVAGAPLEMGLTASAILATKMILRFRPKLVAMVGIAAGVREESQGYGDILAAEHTFDYGSGKVSSDGHKAEFRPDPKPLRVQPRLLDRLKAWERQGTELANIQRQWPGPRVRTQLRMSVGPLASGSAVLGLKEPIAEVLTHWRKLIGIEMEAHGVHYACQNAIDPPPMFLCLKAICDFAHEKGDDWQDYAAFTSTQLCHRFLITEWERLFPT